MNAVIDAVMPWDETPEHLAIRGVDDRIGF
jgi:hypothetical protein